MYNCGFRKWPHWPLTTVDMFIVLAMFSALIKNSFYAHTARPRRIWLMEDEKIVKDASSSVLKWHAYISSLCTRVAPSSVGPDGPIVRFSSDFTDSRIDKFRRNKDSRSSALMITVAITPELLEIFDCPIRRVFDLIFLTIVNVFYRMEIYVLYEYTNTNNGSDLVAT